MVTDRQMKLTLMIELFSTTGLFLSSMAQSLSQLLAGLALALLYAGYLLWVGGWYEIGHIGVIRRSIYTVRFFLYAVFLGAFLKNMVSKILLGGGSGWFLFLPVFLLAIYANRKGRVERARLMEVLFWFVFAPLFLILILAVPNVHPTYLLKEPFDGKAMLQVFLCFSSLEILLFFHGKRMEKAKAVFFVFLLNIFVFLVTVGMYGPVLTEESLIPMATVIQMVRFPGGFIERLDILILAFWILSLFAIFSAYCFYGTYQWKKKGKISIVSLLFYFFLFVMVVWISWDIKEWIEKFQMYVLWIDLPLAIVLPLLNTGKQKRAVAITLLSVVMLLVTACGPKRVDIEDRDYVLALGLEREKEEWKVHFFLSDISDRQAKGKDLDDAFRTFQKESDKKLELGHLKAIIIGKGANLSILKKEWKKDQEYAKTVLLFQTDEKISSYQKWEEEREVPLGNLLLGLAEENKKETTIGEYVSGQKSIPKIGMRTDVPFIQ